MSSRETPHPSAPSPPPPLALSFLIHFRASSGGGGGGVGGIPIAQYTILHFKVYHRFKNPTNTHPTINLTIIPTNCTNVQWIEEMIIRGSLWVCNRKVLKNTRLFTRTRLLLSLCLAWRLIVIQPIM